MRNYRDYLNERNVPKGPWCVLELHNKVVVDNLSGLAKAVEDAIAFGPDKIADRFSGGQNVPD